MTTTSLYSSVENLINYIEDHIEGDLTLESLSSSFCISKFHLIRIFKNLTNFTMMEYVKSRKLACSLYELLYTDMKVIDIALKYHFNYEQSYIRAFKKEFGITPAKFRNNQIPVKIVDRINLDFCTSIDDGILFQPQYIVRPEMKLVGVKDIIKLKDKYVKNLANSRGVNFFHNQRIHIKNTLNPHIYIGLTRLVDHSADYTYYMPSVEVNSFEDIPKGMFYDTLPSCKYAVFHYIGRHHAEYISLHTMKALYDYIYSTWIPANNYDFIREGGFRFEEIDSTITSNDYCEAKIYLPFKL
ncbi:AraC family transcriptional regulator [Alkaliphilus serpentinus]|uniref:AraC family transcriptional regulator n=1 Tax=Alkaliphilus serpentinus TaxID=1482731 RepID=A0A833HQB3_9FIRM|nr:AraC family transcriptional regulator [Alkaliphilus serpentinus]KAB3531556.1 AraC family transcriptional regulator [Alkaliphilus serpentinus]